MLNKRSRAIVLASVLVVPSCGDGGKRGGGTPENLGNNTIAPTSNKGNGVTGKSGSTARFTVLKERLYVASGIGIATFNISDAQKPSKVGFSAINANVESLFNDGQRLYVGVKEGLQIFGVAIPDQPIYMGSFVHAWSCSPVVTAGATAYMTLRGGQPRCPGAINQLYVVDITRPEKTVEISYFPMTNPSGLGVSSNRLFVCDGSKGLVELNLKDPKAIAQTTVVGDEICSDVLPLEKTLLVSGSAGITQYDLVETGLKRLSRIGTNADINASKKSGQ